MAKLIIDGDPGAIRWLRRELDQRSYLGSEYVVTVLDEQEAALMEDCAKRIAQLETQLELALDTSTGVIDYQRARIAELEAACRCAEQTARNLAMATDGIERAVALNEAAALRKALDA
jgi:hypothetical protein